MFINNRQFGHFLIVIFICYPTYGKSYRGKNSFKPFRMGIEFIPNNGYTALIKLKNK